MRVLAIDTALEACSVAVLDTERPGVVTHETRPMQRGHAESLIPMIARVLASEPRLLLLDESLAGLTPTELRDAIALVRRIHAMGITIVMAEVKNLPADTSGRSTSLPS